MVKKLIREKCTYGLNYEKIYYSDNYGPYIVLDTYKRGVYNKWRPTALIRFISTRYEKIVDADNALHGLVIDDTALYKTPIDTSLLSILDRDNRLNRFATNIWEGMIARCYNNNHKNFHLYGAIGVKTCERWLNKDNFIEDLPKIAQYNKWSRFPTLYQLDKDYLQLNIFKNKRVYSPETCIFLYHKDNTNLRAIEFKNNNITASKYFGIDVNKYGKYEVQLRINGTSLWIGTFSNEIAAANAFNYWQLYFHDFDIIPLLNDVPYMSPNEFIKYNTNPKTMCFIVNNEKG